MTNQILDKTKEATESSYNHKFLSFLRENKSVNGLKNLMVKKKKMWRNSLCKENIERSVI